MRIIKYFLVFSVVMSGCAGVSITPLSKKEAIRIYEGEIKAKGYIIYEPLVVVEISNKEVCMKKVQDKCAESVMQCSVGKPFVLPNYSKPYIVDIKSGFGKTGVELEILDGWLLSKVKDVSDNTAILGTLESLLETKSKGGCKDPGIYRVKSTDSGIKLELIKAY